MKQATSHLHTQQSTSQATLKIVNTHWDSIQVISIFKYDEKLCYSRVIDICIVNGIEWIQIYLKLNITTLYHVTRRLKNWSYLSFITSYLQVYSTILFHLISSKSCSL